MSLQAIFDPMVRAYFKNKYGGGSGGSEGGTIVNPDKSGVIKFDDGTYAGRGSGGSRYFKLPYELFTTNPNAQIPYERFGTIICVPNPFDWDELEEYNEVKEECKGVPVEKDVDWTVDGSASGCKDFWVECPPGSGEWNVPIIEVYTDTADYSGVTLTRGLYAKAGKFLPESIEILPEQS